MADIICRWRNGTPKTVVELVNSMPHSVMPNAEFREFMASKWGGKFFRTPYQLACQLGLYYESDDGYYYPRFDHDITEEEALRYLEHWLPRYYIPNPYVGKSGFLTFDCPTYLLELFVNYSEEHSDCDFAQVMTDLFGDDGINNADIIGNYIDKYSKSLRIDRGKLIKVKDNFVDIYIKMDRHDKKSFFQNFNQDTVKKLIEDYKLLPIEERQKMFYQFMRTSGLSESSCSQYAYQHPKQDGVMEVVKIVAGKDSLFDVFGKAQVSEIHEKVKPLEGNKKQGNSWSAAISNYQKFLDYLNVGTGTNNPDNISGNPRPQSSYDPAPESYTQFITAIKTKPFVLLAGISGTGKSRIVRQLARACDTIDENPWTVQKPANFEMIQVRPDWHDGSELLGYESRISGKGEYVVKEFVKFVVKAWIYEHEDVPFFLCLDEMNLAPVEQYFAEYLSVVETRKADKDGNITCDPLIKLNKEYCQSIANAIYPGSEGDAHDAEQLSNVEALMALLEDLDYCIPLPKNLIVMGTVNMDETTFGFSRKVLDRAMTIEMNEVDLAGGLEDTDKERFGIAAADILPTAVEGKDVYAKNKELCDKVIGYLQQVNDVLEDTPFKIAYRTRNEFLVYAVNRGEDNLTDALDEMTSMKILSRIEGDQDKVGLVLEGLEQVMTASGLAEDGLSRKKVKAMAQRLKSGYTSYWN